MHDTTKQFTGQFTDPGTAPIVQRGKQTVLAFHAFAKMTTSCAWLKFGATLFRQGFNVILLDLPGFGKSSVARDVSCSVESWQSWDVSLVTNLISKMNLGQVNILACYESAPMLFHLMRDAPQVLGRNHVIHNVRFRFVLFCISYVAHFSFVGACT